jgi:hypothetical protein
VQILTFLAPGVDRGEDAYGDCEECAAWEWHGFAEDEMLGERGKRKKRDRCHDYEQDKA